MAQVPVSMFECQTQWEYECKKNGHFILKTKTPRCHYCGGRVKVKKVHCWGAFRAGFFHDANQHGRFGQKAWDVVKVPLVLAGVLVATGIRKFRMHGTPPMRAESAVILAKSIRVLRSSGQLYARTLVRSEIGDAG